MADIWEGIKSVVGEYAPTLANAIVPGSGTAVALIADFFGLDSADPESVKSALDSATPEQLAKLREIEYAHKEKLIELGIKADEVRLADVASARKREQRIVEATGEKDINLYILAWTIVLGFFALCGVLMAYPLPEGSNQVVFMLFGGLVSAFTGVVQYFFGSSKGSADKNKLLSAKGGTTK